MASSNKSCLPTACGVRRGNVTGETWHMVGTLNQSDELSLDARSAVRSNDQLF
jgi:hypothetical protein